MRAAKPPAGSVLFIVSWSWFVFIWLFCFCFGLRGARSARRVKVEDYIKDTGRAQTEVNTAPLALNVCLLVFGNEAEQPVFFVGDSSGEINSVAEWKKIPQTVKLQWRTIGSDQRFEKTARRWIVVVDSAIAKVADP